MDLYINLTLNLSLLILIAVIITKVPLVRKILYKERDAQLSSQLILAVIFGLFCIFSTCIGQKIEGAIQNTRVIGALAGGLYGGPIVGIGAAIIGAVHRFLYDPHGFSSIACCVSTLFEGLLGSVIWKIFQDKEKKQTPISLLLITVFAELCQMGIILLIAKPFSAALHLVHTIALPMIILNSLGMILFFSIFEDVFDQQSKVEEQIKLRREAELKALQSQINPHFLFNSLNTISYFCREKPDKARQLLQALSVYFRNTLDSSEEYMSSLKKEMGLVKAYLMLEEARFEDKLQIKIDVDEDLDYTMPTLILQPIVENAVKHGAMKRTAGTVEIIGKDFGNFLRISVEDNGPGISKEAMERFKSRSTEGKYGLVNVEKRLEGLYGKKNGLKIKTGDKGTVITIEIPDGEVISK